MDKWATAALSQLSTCPQPGLHQRLKEPKGHQRIYRMKLALSGYFSLKELLDIRGPLGLTLEEDDGFEAVPLSNVRSLHE